MYVRKTAQFLPFIFYFPEKENYYFFIYDVITWEKI